MNDERQKAILRLTARFLAGEEAVTLDLLPLILAIARQGRLEEEMFLTTFLFEEAKHTDFFTRWLREVPGSPRLPRAPEPSVRLFDVELPTAMNALLEDQSPVAIARASVTYNMVIEGVLAETGYHSYHQSLAVNNLDAGSVRRAGQHQARRVATHRLRRLPPEPARGRGRGACGRRSRSGWRSSGR